LRFLREQLSAQYPMGLEKVILLEIHPIEVLDDAPNLHVRKSKSLGQNLQSPPLDQFLFENLTVEIYDRAIRLDGPSLYVHHLLASLEEWNFDIGMLPPLFGQDLDAKVIVFVGRVDVVIPVHLPVQNDGGRSRRQRFAGHLELIG